MPSDNSPYPEWLRAELGDNFRTGVTLAEHAHFRIGGPADCFYNARSVPELIQAAEAAQKMKCPLFLMGGGFNLLFDDGGFRGLIVKNSASGIKRISQEKLKVFSGTPLPDLIRFCIREGLGGAEFLAGIPGTLGGAVSGNAGAFDHAIGELISQAVLLKKNGSIRTVGRGYFQFGYRDSLLKKTGEVVLEAVLELGKKECRLVRDEVNRVLAARKGKHPPWGIACAGSYFKNPVLPSGKKVPAGYLLEKSGAKKLKVGDAEVYRKHANFIINKGNASCRDVRALAEEMRRRVKNKFHFNLEEEVIYLPASS
ncbi:MAG: UDP-N-acetylmuramate dehydrogenase [Candidatus Aminicenantes bacterium]